MFHFEREVFIILRLKYFSLILVLCFVFLNITTPVSAGRRDDTADEIQWMRSDDSIRYFMSTQAKADAVGLTYNEFVFFARVVEGEGADSADDITDKVLVACTVLNRMRCSAWPTTTVLSTLQRPGQFLVVDQETHQCNMARSLDSEWAIVIAYRLINAGEVDCHMVYYNSIGFTGYSRAFTDYAYFGGNYFSVIPCDCESCTSLEPDWVEEEVEMLGDDFIVLRPEGVEAHYV